MNRAMTLTDWSALLMASVLIGSSFLFINISIQEISPFTAAALRALCAVPVCWVLMRAFGASWPSSREQWGSFLLLGLITGAIPYGAVAWGQQHLESGMAGILFGTMPILSVLIAPLFLAEESFTRTRLIGGAIGLVGIVVLTGPSVFAKAGVQTAALAITFLAPLGQTLGGIYARKQTGLTPPVIATGQVVVGAVALVPLAFATETPLTIDPSARAIVATIVSGAVCTALGVSLYFIVVQRIGATRSTLVPLFFPVVAVVLGIVVLDERLAPEVFVGLLLILLGAAAVSWRVERR